MRSRWRSARSLKILEQLPTDLQKLTWLCKLSPEQLDNLLGRVDCKEEGRQHVIDAVKALLPDHKSKTPRPTTPDKVVQSFKQSAAKTASVLKKASPEVTVPIDVRARLHEALDEALAELQGSEQDSPGKGPSTPSGDDRP